MEYKDFMGEYGEILDAFQNLTPVDRQKAINYMKALSHKDNSAIWKLHPDLMRQVYDKSMQRGIR